jgi:hypothetical protein
VIRRRGLAASPLATAAATLLTACLASGHAGAQPAEDAFSPRAAVEVRGGPDAPGGTWSLGLALQLFRRLELTGSAGSAGTDTATGFDSYAASARIWALRGKRLSLGLELGTSYRQYRLLNQVYQRPGLPADHIGYELGWRTELGVAGRWQLSDSWYVQAAAGAGAHLFAPDECAYSPGGFQTDCHSPSIPAYLHINPRPVRAYGQLAVGYQSGGGYGVDGRRPDPDGDPRIGSAALAPTARVNAPGTFTIGLESVVSLGASYVLPTGTELSGRLLLVLPGGAVLVKHPLVDAGRFRLAAVAAGGGLTYDDTSAAVYGAGAIAGVCIAHDCESLLSLMAVGGASTEDEETSLTWLTGPNLLLALNERTKLIAELDLSLAYLDTPVGLVAFRWHGARVAADLGLFYAENEVLPYLSVSWRPAVKKSR